MINLVKFGNSKIYSRFIICTLFHKNLRFFHIEHLNQRSLIKVSGEHSFDFLQGLITNDINKLRYSTSIYSMFLNAQGRVLFECIMLNDGAGNILLDCDTNIVAPLINHMKLYKVRRKVSFESLNSFKIYVAFSPYSNSQESSITSSNTTYETFFKTLNLPPKISITYPDPRLSLLGWRIIVPVSFYSDSFTSDIPFDQSFLAHRYKLGVGEGVNDFFRGKSLPLEANCDYLNGVDFQKGCYIGQELTARTYHTGVIRKRFMPLHFDSEVIIERNSTISNENGKNCGKVINIQGNYGIGILRIADALNSKFLSTRNLNLITYKPDWWS